MRPGSAPPLHLPRRRRPRSYRSRGTSRVQHDRDRRVPFTYMMARHRSKEGLCQVQQYLERWVSSHDGAYPPASTVTPTAGWRAVDHEILAQ